jgi:hypothetical protein
VRENKAVLFPISAFGLAIAGSSKGLIYVPVSSLRYYILHDSTDNLPRDGNDYEYIVPIEGNWYVYFERS